MRRLEQLLRDNDHRPYPAYKNLKGRYTFPNYILSVDHVQGDPFAAPSSLSIHMSRKQHGMPDEYMREPHRRIMLQDYLLRGFHRELKNYDHKAGGSGKSGSLSVSKCGQEVLERSALVIDPTDGLLVLRFSAGFPAAGRTTLAMELKKMLYEYVPSCVVKTLRYAALNKETLNKWISLSDDQRAIREQLKDKGLVAFVANNSVLPRKSGVDERPMNDAVKFISTKEDEVTLKLPGDREITGLGIKEGITLIVGGGYHGKSTLLKALERGVYNHIPGDGREYVITEDSAMKLRSEDGRSIKQLNISAFIRNLPNGRDTVCFSTEDASGSTSQAANTVEAMMAGSSTLLIDEDTSATNFMVRDALMHEVIHPGEEPIIPFISRMRSLYEDCGISTVLVAGSSGAFFDVSDTILQMKEYNPINITKAAKNAALKYADVPYASGESKNDHKLVNDSKTEDSNSVININIYDIGKISIPVDNRKPCPNTEVTGSRKVKVRGSGTDSVSLNHEAVEIRFVEQVVDNEQTNLLGAMLRELEERYFNGKKTLSQCVNELYSGLISRGFEAAVMSGQIPGNYAMVRRQELWAMVNRYRGLRV